MRNSRFLLIAMMFLSWLSIPFLGWKYIRRFLPATMFMSVVIYLESIFAEKRLWWVVFQKIHPRVMGEAPFIMGLFFAGTLWILRFTFGRFIPFLFMNGLANFLFAYPFYTIFKRIGIFTLLRLKRYQLMGLFFIKSLLLYSVQLLYESKINKKRNYFFKV